MEKNTKNPEKAYLDNEVKADLMLKKSLPSKMWPLTLLLLLLLTTL